MQKKPVAFFDIDGTLFRSSLLIELVEELIAVDLFPIEAQETYRAQFAAWQARTGSYDAYIAAVIKTFLEHLKEVHYQSLQRVGHQVVERKGKQIYRFTRDYTKQLQAQGYALVAISQSPKLILDDFCKDYGFDKVYGRRYETTKDGLFTGRVIDEEIISDKSQVVDRIFSRHPEYTRENSVAVGDTDGDIPLLSAVETPICFNPNQVLYDYATSKSWSVVVERKDVVYHL